MSDPRQLRYYKLLRFEARVKMALRNIAMRVLNWAIAILEAMIAKRADE